MKNLDYDYIVRSNISRFVRGEGKFARKFAQIPTTEKLKPDPLYHEEIKFALRLWIALDPSSQLFDSLEGSLARKDEFVSRYYWEACRRQCKALHEELAEVMHKDGDKYVRTVGMLTILSDRVVRRWLWHENVDFQSRESFLRRLTDEQYRSLQFHYNLVEQGVPEERLPCFTEGVQNKIWNILRPTTKTEDKMAVKAAIAYDFLGMGMGFQLYPSLDNDRKANRELATQFLSKSTDRGAFEVNKEEGGLYWLLYRTLRSNALYGADKHVELGNWICPGFWFTMIAWFAFAVVSPVSLIAGGLLYALKGLVIWPLWAVGSVCPLALTIVGVKKACGKAYTEDYWKGVMFASLAWMAFSFAVLVVALCGTFPSFYVGVLCFIFLAPYQVMKEEPFWRAPILGKLLPAVFLAVLVYDLYTKSLFFEFWWDVLLAGIGYLVTAWYWMLDLLRVYGVGLLLTITAFAVYAGVLYLIYKLSSWSTTQIKEKISKSDRRAYYYEYLMNGAPLALGALVLLGCAWFFVSSGDVIVFALLLIFMMIGPTFLFFSNLNNRSVKNETRWMLTSAIPLSRGDEIYSCVTEAIRLNSFWRDVRYFEARSAMLHALAEKMSKLSYYGRTDFITACLVDVRNEEEVMRLERFVASELFQKTLNLRPSAQLVRRILSGTSEAVLRERIAFEQQDVVVVRQKKTYFPVIAVEAWLEKYVGVPMKKFFMALGWPFQMTWKGVLDLYALWETFNEQCPQSPPRNRKAV